MTPHQIPKLAWLCPLLVLMAGIFIEMTGAAGIARATGSAGAVAFYNFAPGLTQRALQRPALAGEIERAFMIAGAAAIIFALMRARLRHAAIVTLVMIGLAFGLSWLAAKNSYLFYDWLYPSLVFLAMFAAGAVFRLTGNRNETRLIQALEPRLPPDMMRDIKRRPEMLKPGGETRTVTHLACGARDFALLAERYASDPSGLVHLIRRLMAALTEAVLAHGGTLDQTAPGRVTAFFNAPLEDLDHAVHACACALRMTEDIIALNRALARVGGIPPIEIAIGLSTGPGIAADFGTGPRFAYGVAGAAAERAEELKDLAAHYGFAIIASEATRASAERRLAFLQIDLASSRSGGAAEPIFAVIGNQHMRSSPKFKALQTFHRSIFEAYGMQNWHRTRELVGQCRTLSGASQPLYDYYLDRIAHYEANPPDEAWNGNFRSAAT